ncbi:MAG: hypothetical protein KF822_12495 [Steroidobacteraceae bacterium]|nr:hypothetical protein [Steroidobacteraceae bacterium]
MAIVAAPVLASASVIGSAASKVGEGVAGLFGDTATDKARKDRAALLTNAALAGDVNALRQLAFDAFEPRLGYPGDSRTPIDGKRSPEDTRNLARRGLQQYVAKFGGLPSELAQYAGQLGAPVLDKAPTVLERVLAPVVNTVTDQALDRAATRAAESARQVAPWMIGGAVLIAVAVALYVGRK